MTRQSDREEAAASWANRLDQPAIDTSSGPAFDRWMSDAGNADAFADIQALWHSDTLKEALQQAAVDTGTMAEPAKENGWSLRKPWAMGLAAAACALLVVAITLFSDISFATYRTGLGEGRAILLADGSHVDLSGNTELQVRILPWQRSATLVRGEAYFDVRHERARAFRVHSGTTTVRVLGTAFNVDRQSETRTTVEVFRGAVEVNAPDAHQLVLHRGERTRILDGQMAARPLPSIAKAPDWKSGWFEADDVPMSVLFAKVQRYSDRPIEFENAKLGAVPISGRFKVSDPARVLSAVREAYGVDVRYDREHIRIVSSDAKRGAAANP